MKKGNSKRRIKKERYHFLNGIFHHIDNYSENTIILILDFFFCLAHCVPDYFYISLALFFEHCSYTCISKDF